MLVDLFDADWYLRRYPDVAAAVQAGQTDARTHFETFGMHEGRSPGPLFDTAFYLSRNPDVAAAVAAGLTTPYEHFVHFGAAEGRSPLPWFDADFYLLHNSDVAQTVGPDTWSGVEHFVMYGWRENRKIGPLFDADAYLRANPDVAAAVQRGEFTALEHFLLFGVIEGREWDDTPAPVPPPPPPPPPPDDDGPVTVHHLYPNDEITARAVDQRFVIHVERGQESWITIHDYAGHHVLDMSRVPGMRVFDDDRTLRLEVLRGEYDGSQWTWEPPYAGDSLGVRLDGTGHVQLPDTYGTTVHMHVGANANSFGYADMWVNIADLFENYDIRWPADPGAKLLVGSLKRQLFPLFAGDMALGRGGGDVYGLVAAEITDGPAIIGDYKYANDVISFLVPEGEEPPFTSPFSLEMVVSDNHLVPGEGLVPGGNTDLEVRRKIDGAAILHVADFENGAGAKTKSVGMLLADGIKAIFNVHDGGEIDTTKGTAIDAWADLMAPDCDCGCDCEGIEYLIGGVGKQTIKGGNAGMAVLIGGAGNDELSSDAAWAAYIGGEGNDTITMSDEGDGMVVFAGSADANGEDSIIGFKAGGDDPYDVLDFSEFLWDLSLLELMFWSGDSEELAESIAKIWSELDDEILSINRVLVKDFGKFELTPGDFDPHAARMVGLNVHDNRIWFYTNEPAEVKLVGTIDFARGDASALTEANFTTYVEFGDE